MMPQDPPPMPENTFKNKDLCTQLTPPRSLIDKIFGGTKKAWILIMTLGVLGLYYTKGEVPQQLMLVYISIISVYFGAGSVKLGMDMK